MPSPGAGRRDSALAHTWAARDHARGAGALLIALYSQRSERQLCEPLESNLLFRWFLGMDMLGSAAAYLTGAAYNLVRVSKMRSCAA